MGPGFPSSLGSESLLGAYQLSQALVGSTAAYSECVSVPGLSWLCPVKPPPAAAPPALPEASALLAVTEADGCLMGGG